MGRRFLLAFITLSAFFFTLRARPDGSAARPEPDPVSVRSRVRARLQIPEPEKSIPDPPSAKEPPAEKADHDDEERETAAEAPMESESRKVGKHHSTDKSVAGGGVIIGGLVTAIFAAVYCYIRVTRRRPAEYLARDFY